MRKKKITPAQRYAVFTVHGEKCYLCNRPLNLQGAEVDHILPESLLHDPVRLSKILNDFGLPTDFNLNSYENWMPAHGRCNREKLDEVFNPTPQIQLQLQRAAKQANKAIELEKQEISEKAIARAINLLQRAKDKGKLSAESKASVRLLLTLQTFETHDIIYGLARLVQFHERHRLPELKGQPVDVTPFIQASLQGDVLTVSQKGIDDSIEENSYPVQLMPCIEEDLSSATPPAEANPPDNVQMSEHLRVLGRRFVALTCRLYSPPDPETGEEDKEGVYFAASGFIVAISGAWFLVTAGHIIAHIREILNQGGRCQNWHLDDTFALGKKRAIYVDGPGATETIPFVFGFESIISHFDRDEGTDFAFIYLTPYYVDLLRRNDVTAFDEEEWTLDVNTSADCTELVGMPHDQTRHLGNYRVTKILVALKVHRVNDDAHYKPEFAHLFQGHIPGLPTQVLPNFERIHGMSGGPLVGFWTLPDGSEKMRVLGIQNRWYPEDQTVVATPVGYLAAGIKEYIVKRMHGQSVD
jgi:hypothetical protein